MILEFKDTPLPFNQPCILSSDTRNCPGRGGGGGGGGARDNWNSTVAN